MAEDNIKKRIREHMESTKDSGIAFQFFKKKAETEERREGIRKISAAVRELEEDKRVIGAVQPFFDSVTQRALARVEIEYPVTAQLFFELAQEIIQGSFGHKIQESGQSEAEWLFQSQKLLYLLFFHSAKKKRWPEIMKKDEPFLFTKAEAELPKLSIEDSNRLVFDQPEKNREIQVLFNKMVLQLVVDLVDWHTLQRLFRNYLHNFANPSHVAIDLLLEKEPLIEKPIKAAMSIKNPSQRSKSLVNIITHLSQCGEAHRAIETLHAIRAKKERTKPLTNFFNRFLSHKRKSKEVEELIRSGEMEEAIALAKELSNREERENIYQRVAFGLARHGYLNKALNIAQLITEQDSRAYTLSNIAHELATANRIEEAKTLIPLIEEEGFQEDAIMYIVRAYIFLQTYEDAIQFIEKIANPSERVHAAKLLLSSVVATHNQQRIDEICEKFELAK